MLKRIALCGVALLTVASLVARAEDAKPITNAGASNLSFAFGGLSTLALGPVLSQTAGGTGNGLAAVYSVGYRYFIANEMAVRASFGVTMNNKTATAKDMTDATDNTTGFLVGVGIEKHMVSGPITGFFGGQLGFLSGSRKQVSARATASTAGESSQSSSGTDIVVAGMAGAEFFFNSYMSLGCEYNFGLVLSSSSTESVTNGTSNPAVDGPSQTAIGTNAVGMGINIYIGR
jgi:hypothetical protein